LKGELGCLGFSRNRHDGVKEDGHGSDPSKLDMDGLITDPEETYQLKILMLTV